MLRAFVYFCSLAYIYMLPLICIQSYIYIIERGFYGLLNTNIVLQYIKNWGSFNECKKNFEDE